jgi:branched-chain amino acid aminotransferase
MINFNGNISALNNHISVQNRGFLYGDGVFETVKIVDSKVLYVEDHYFRLMSSMRILRMEIPMAFTLEYIEQQLLNTAMASNVADNARVRMTVFRNEGGYYDPLDNNISFIITATAGASSLYLFSDEAYEVDLYKDYYVTKQLLSTIKSTSKIINITGSIYARENGLQNCLLLNDSKNVIEALNGNLFMLVGNKLTTPPVSEGCLKGVMRKQVMEVAAQNQGIEVVEEVISPFDLQKADELFITNVIVGVQPITRYRKKDYRSSFSAQIVHQLNAKIRLG